MPVGRGRNLRAAAKISRPPTFPSFDPNKCFLASGHPWHYFLSVSRHPLSTLRSAPGAGAALVLAVAVLGTLGCFPAAQRAPLQAQDLLPGSEDVVAGPGQLRTATVPAPVVKHVVQRGQTLWRIARSYGIELDALARANNLADPTRITVGQILVVPGAAQPIEVVPYTAALPLSAQPASYSVGAPTVPVVTGAFLWPVAGGRLLSPFGVPRPGHRHQGIDIKGEPGQPVLAASPGRVVFSGNTQGGYGKTVVLEHEARLHSLYAHNSDLLVEEGQWVERGQTIARVGRTGNASTEHCHFEIREGSAAIDPLSRLERAEAPQP